MQARAYSPFWRIVSGLLLVCSRGGMLVLLVLLLFFETRLTNPLRLIRVFTLVCLLPELAAWLVGRAFEISLRSGREALVLDYPDRSVEIPFESIERVEPWTVPIPAQGLWIRLKSGSRYPHGLEVGDPADLAATLPVFASALPGRDGSSAGRSRAALQLADGGRRHWHHVLLQYPVFALVPTLPLFRLHQWITYGGTFGEYYVYGLQAYVLAFLVYWANATIWLVLYSAALRVLVSAGVVLFVLAAPAQTRAARRVGDVVHRFLYFGGVLAFLARLYLLSRV